MARVKKTRRYKHGDVFATVGESRDDLPSTDRRPSALIDLEAIVHEIEAEDGLVTRLRNEQAGQRSYERPIVMMLFVVPFIVIVVALIAHSL